MGTEKIKLSLSDKANENYIASVAVIKEIEPIEGADRLVKTIIDGYPMVISNTMKVGDIVIYCMLESTLNENYLSANNLFDISNYQMNSNSNVVQKLIDSDDKDGAKSLVGFFNAQGRVKTLSIRSTPSQGFICDFETLKRWKPDLDISNIDKLVGKAFDTVNDELFIKKYEPIIKSHNSGGTCQHIPKIGKFDRLVPRQFNFHYDTSMLNKNIHHIEPTSKIHISVKKHGTSFVDSRILTYIPLTFIQKIKRFFGCKERKIGYGNVYSSASVIRNRYGYNNQVNNFSGVDVYADANKILYPLLSDGMTVYAELFGYVKGTNKFIQKGYDYGCKVGEFIIMPYRITTTNSNGEIFEWLVDEVIDWTNKQLTEHNELINILAPTETIYSGYAKDLYPTIPINESWQDNFLEALKMDKEMYMECDDPSCKNKVPFEGIVLKIADSRESKAYKLKCQNFYLREQRAVDKGEIDMETAEKLNKC